MLPILRAKFEDREKKVMHLIIEYEKKYDLCWDTIGVFGSYARDEATGCSDIDFCIFSEKPDPGISGCLREEADGIGADIIFITKDEFLHGDSLLSKNLRHYIKFIRGGFDYEK